MATSHAKTLTWLPLHYKTHLPYCSGCKIAPQLVNPQNDHIVALFHSIKWLNMAKLFYSNTRVELFTFYNQKLGLKETYIILVTTASVISFAVTRECTMCLIFFIYNTILKIVCSLCQSGCLLINPMGSVAKVPVRILAYVLLAPLFKMYQL